MPPLDKSLRVLVVDDSPTMRNIMVAVLKQLGLTNVLVADDGDTALAIINKESIGLVLCDWTMRRMHGIKVLEAVRADDRHKDLPFIMVTAETEKSYVLQAIKMGVSNYVVKPFDANTLSKKILKVFAPPETAQES